MKKILSLIMLILTFSCTKKFDVNLSKEVVRKEIQIEDFDFYKIQLTSNLKLVLAEGDENKIELETDKNYFQYVLFHRQGNALDIRRSNSAITTSKVDATIYLTTNNVRHIAVFDHSNVEVVNCLEEKNIFLDVQSKSIFTGSIDCIRLNTLLMDQSKLSISGKADSLNIDSKENSFYNIDDLSYKWKDIKED